MTFFALPALLRLPVLWASCFATSVPPNQMDAVNRMVVAAQNDWKETHATMNISAEPVRGPTAASISSGCGMCCSPRWKAAAKSSSLVTWHLMES